MAVWTVGHSNHEMRSFLDLLRSQHLECVVDVRSYPFSQFAPQFNRDELWASLRSVGIRYLFLGEQLGGRPTRDEHYDAEGHALYGAMAAELPFTNAIDRLVCGSETVRIAIMCSCGKPRDCHRRLLVGKVLTDRGVTLQHILPDGSVQTEAAVSIQSEIEQPALFTEEGAAWRSTQSVSHRRRLSTSSAA